MNLSSKGQYKQIDSTSKAEIINHIKNYQQNPIFSIKSNNIAENSNNIESQFKMAIKLLKFIDPQHNFVKRLFPCPSQTISESKYTLQSHRVKLWLFPNQLEFQPDSSFQSIDFTGMCSTDKEKSMNNDV